MKALKSMELLLPPKAVLINFEEAASKAKSIKSKEMSSFTFDGVCAEKLKKLASKGTTKPS